MADAADTKALLLTIQANTELLRSNLSAAERAVKEFTDQTAAHLEASDAKFELFGHSIEALEGPFERLKVAGEAAFAFFVGESIVEKTHQMLEFAGGIEVAAEKIGVTTTFLQQMRFAAGQTSVSIEAMELGLTKFTRSIGEAANGNKAAVTAFQNVGKAAGGTSISVLDSAGKVRSVEAVYLDVATALSKIPDAAREGADAQALFGRGAAQLKPLLDKGADGFRLLAEQAESLGVVLSPELIENSEKVNHQLSALKGIVDAQMASAVAQNAGAIADLGNAFLDIIPKAERALSAVRDLYHEAQYYFNFAQINLPYITQEKRTDAIKGAALADYNISADAAGHTIHDRLDQQPAWLREQVLKQFPSSVRQQLGYGGEGKAEGNRLGSDEAGDHNPDVSHHKKGKSAEELAKEAEAERQRKLAEERAWDRELGAAEVAYNKAEADLADTAQQQLAAELAALQEAKIAKADEVRSQVAAGKITEAQGQQLLLLLDKTEDDQEELARRKARARLADEANARAQLALQGQIALLGLDEKLATTRQQRLTIELKLLDLQEQAAIREQQKIIDASQPGSQASKNAQTTIDQINAQHGRSVDIVKQQNAGPLDAYKKQLHEDTDSMTDALQSVEVDGLKSLQDGLLGIISGTESVGDAFKKMADQIIADLARIYIEKFIVGLISGLAGGGKVDGGVGYSAGGIPYGYAAGGIPGFADGNGRIRGPGTGTSDSILAVLGNRKLIRLSDGESINTAESTARNWPMIDAMNKGRVPGFAGGGLPSMRAPSIPSLSGMSSGGGMNFNMPVVINAPGADAAALKRVQDSIDQLREEVPGTAVQAVAEAQSRFILR